MWANSSDSQKEYSEKDNLLERIDKVANKGQNSTYSNREVFETFFHTPRKVRTHNYFNHVKVSITPFTKCLIDSYLTV